MRSNFDLHDNCKVLNALDHAAISTDTTTVGNIIDTLNFNMVEFTTHLATITDGAYTALLQEGDNSALSDAATVSAEETLGSITYAATEDDICKRIGYIGKKRYVRLSIVSTSTTTGVSTASASVMLAAGAHNPQANQ